MKRVLIFLLLIAILSLDVRAVGLMSGSIDNTIKFVPNYQATYNYRIVPDNEYTSAIKVYMSDLSSDGTTTDLAKYFYVSQDMFYDIIPGENPMVTVTVRLPNEIEEPGTHVVKLNALEISKIEGIGAVGEVSALFSVYVPYDGEYLVFEFNAENANQGTPIKFTTYLHNRGNSEIKSLQQEIQLIDRTGNVVANATSEVISVPGQSDKEITLEIPTTNLLSGTYTANTLITHGKNVDQATAMVKVGDLSFSIINQTDSITAGKINKFEIEVESNWGESVDNVYAEIIIDGQTVKTAGKTIEPFGKDILSGYVDATDLSVGLHDVEIILHYGDKTTTKKIAIEVIKKAEFNIPKLASSQIIIFAGIVIVLITNIILFMILMRKKDEKEKTV